VSEAHSLDIADPAALMSTRPSLTYGRAAHLSLPKTISARSDGEVRLAADPPLSAGEPTRQGVNTPARRGTPVLSENSIWSGFASRTPIYTSGKRAARSLLCALGFPVRPQIFPALAAREFRSQPIEFPPESRGASVISKPEIGEIPCIFPVIRESDKRREVHCRLPAQPPSRVFFGSLPTLIKRARRSPEMRPPMAVVLRKESRETRS
jgi:hypothetical protein